MLMKLPSCIFVNALTVLCIRQLTTVGSPVLPVPVIRACDGTILYLYALCFMYELALSFAKISNGAYVRLCYAML